MLHVAPFKMVNTEAQKQGNKVSRGNDSEGQGMNRNATKVSDYGPIFCAWSRTERSLLCSNDGRRRLGRKEETEGQMMER